MGQLSIECKYMLEIDLVNLGLTLHVQSVDSGKKFT